MGYQDTQQICLNGHQITDNYNRSPEFRRTFCDKCGAKTIHQCPKCGVEIYTLGVRSQQLTNKGKVSGTFPC